MATIIVACGSPKPTKAELVKFRLLCDEFTQEDGMSISEAMIEAAKIIKKERGKSDDSNRSTR